MLLVFSKPLNFDIIDAATEYLDFNVDIMAVSIGKEWEQKLGAISSSYEYELHVNSFDDLAKEAVSAVGEWINPSFAMACKSFVKVYSLVFRLKIITSPPCQLSLVCCSCNTIDGNT